MNKLNKIKMILVSVLSIITLASCGEKPDTTLYSVELSSNITLTAAQKAGLTAELAFGADGKGSRDEYEVEELKKAGATDADIEKVGKLQDDGKYYFYDQDPMYLNAPEVEDYMFRGFYEKGTDKFVYKRHADATTGLDNRWNCPGKNIELEARYEKLTYDYYFNTVEAGQTNPNGAGSYCPILEHLFILFVWFVCWRRINFYRK